jgi:hypothetical protein
VVFGTLARYGSRSLASSGTEMGSLILALPVHARDDGGGDSHRPEVIPSSTQVE